MFVADNYGSKWVKSMLNWFRSKTLNGIDYTQLIIESTLECGLRKSKTIEMVNEYVELGIITVENGILYWNNSIKPAKIIMKQEDVEKEIKNEIIKHNEDFNFDDIPKEILDKYNVYLDKNVANYGASEKGLLNIEQFIEALNRGENP